MHAKWGVFMPNIDLEIKDDEMKIAVNKLFNDLSISIKGDTAEMRAAVDYVKGFRGIHEAFFKRQEQAHKVGELSLTVDVKDQNYEEKYKAYKDAFFDFKNFVTNQVNLGITQISPIPDSFKNDLNAENVKFVESSRALILKHKSSADSLVKMITHHFKIKSDEHKKFEGAQPIAASVPQHAKASSAPLLSSSPGANNRASQAKADAANRPLTAESKQNNANKT
jgi:hypothetical protein